MKKQEIIKNVEEIAEKILDNSKEKDKKEILVNKIMKYLSNARDEKEQYYILDLVRKVSWYSNAIIYKFINEQLLLFNISSSAFIKFKSNDSYSSSSNSIYLNLCSTGEILANQIVDIDKITNGLKTDTIIIIDDFIGSGGTIKKVLDKLESLQIVNSNINIITYICHKVGRELIENYKSGNNNKINFNYCIEDDSFFNKNYDKELSNYVLKICDSCIDANYKFGFKECGTLIGINGVSPNNNLSLLWNNNIANWNPLLDRDINILVLTKRKQEYLKQNRIGIFSFYKSSEKLNKIITFFEFEMLVLVYNCYGIDIKSLNKFGICDSINILNEIVKTLIAKKIIKIENAIIEIIDSNILEELKSFENLTSTEMYKKEKSKKFY